MQAPHLCSTGDGKPATHLCSCESRVAYFCHEHLSAHINTDGQHLSRKLPAVPPSGPLCSVCSSQPAAELCCCRFPAPLLCVEHRNQHVLLETSVLHRFFPISQVRLFQTSDTSLRAKKRLKALQKIKVHYEKNFEVIANCEAAVQARYAELLQQLETVRNKLLADLAELRSALTRSFETAAQHFTEHVLDPEYKPATSLEASMQRVTSGGDFSAFLLVRFEKRDIDARLGFLFGVTWESRFNPKTEKIEPEWLTASPLRLAVLSQRELCLYDSVKSTWRKIGLNKDIVVAASSGQIFLPDEQLFSCGALVSNAPKADAYKINIRTGAVQVLEPMAVARCYHSLHYFNKHVLVFGGYNMLRQCEKYSLETGKWASIGNMQFQRQRFNHCEYKGLLYMVGGCCSNSEVFDPVLEEFRALPLALPESSAAIAHVCGDKLVVIMESRILSVEPRTLNITSNKTHYHYELYSSIQPVFFRNELLIVSQQQFAGVSRISIEGSASFEVQSIISRQLLLIAAAANDFFIIEMSNSSSIAKQ